MNVSDPEYGRKDRYEAVEAFLRQCYEELDRETKIDARLNEPVFPPAIRGELPVRIWNHQLIRYAGYCTDDGVVGAPDSTALTDYCRSRGWSGPGTEFDVLPLVI